MAAITLGVPQFAYGESMVACGMEEAPPRTGVVLVAGESCVDGVWKKKLLSMIRSKRVTHLLLTGNAAWLDFSNTLGLASASSSTNPSAMVQARFRDLVRFAAFREEGLSSALGRWIHQYRADCSEQSLLGAAWGAGVPVATHWGMAVVELVPFMQGLDGALGKAVCRDWRLLSDWMHHPSPYHWLVCQAQDTATSETLRALQKATLGDFVQSIDRVERLG